MNRFLKVFLVLDIENLNLISKLEENVQIALPKAVNLLINWLGSIDELECSRSDLDWNTVSLVELKPIFNHIR